MGLGPDIVAPRHRDFIQNTTTGALQADTAHIMAPADGNSVTATAEDSHEAMSAKTDPCNGVHTDESVLRQSAGLHHVQVHSGMTQD